MSSTPLHHHEIGVAINCVKFPSWATIQFVHVNAEQWGSGTKLFSVTLQLPPCMHLAVSILRWMVMFLLVMVARIEWRCVCFCQLRIASWGRMEINHGHTKWSWWTEKLWLFAQPCHLDVPIFVSVKTMKILLATCILHYINKPGKVLLKPFEALNMLVINIWSCKITHVFMEWHFGICHFVWCKSSVRKICRNFQIGEIWRAALDRLALLS